MCSCQHDVVKLEYLISAFASFMHNCSHNVKQSVLNLYLFFNSIDYIIFNVPEMIILLVKMSLFHLFTADFVSMAMSFAFVYIYEYINLISIFLLMWMLTNLFTPADVQ